VTKSSISNPRPLVLLLTICLLCAVAVTPLLRSDAPCTHDGGLHYYRVVAMRQALQDGILFTRYLPDLAFGYGYPFFNYRAPASYYLALALYLTGLTLPTALNLVYVLSIVGSAATAYLLARDLFGPQAGIVAAAAYAYAPYQFLNALLRGNAPESLALPLMPLILWAFRRLALTGRRRWFLTSVGSLATLYLTHNISSLLFTPFLIAYLLTLWLAYRRKGYWIAAGGALTLALGSTAFFLGPALLEQEYAQLHMSRVTRNNDFHYNFLGLAEIFAPPRPVDTSLLNPPMQIHLGLAPAILAAIGLAIGLISSASSGQSRWHDRERRATLIFFALAAATMVGMSTSASLWLWENLPLISFAQFPWRFIGRAALPIAILAGAAVSTTPSNTSHASRLTFCVSRVLPSTLITLLILAALPSAYPPHGYCHSKPHPTTVDVFTYEHRSKLAGVDPEGSYFPIWVKRRPTGSSLEEQYVSDDPIARFDETVLPEGASIVEAGYGPNQAHIIVETSTPFRARYLAFYFPGWSAIVDGEQVPIVPTDPEGLISFDVPAGSHTIVVRFGSTPIRTTFTVLSTLSLAALLVLVFRYLQPPNLQPLTQSHSPQTLPSVIGHLSFVIVALLLLALKLIIVDRVDTPFRHPTLEFDSTLPGVEHPLNQPYADGLTLVGYDQSHTSLPADGILRLDLYWTAYTQPTASYQAVVHLVGADGLRWSQPDSFRPRGYASYPSTRTWSPDRYALDSHEVEPLPGTPPGEYNVVLTAFDHDTLVPLSVLNKQGQPAAPELILGQVTLTCPGCPMELPTGDRLDLSLGDFTLLTAAFDRDQAAPGDSVFLTTFWQAVEQPTENLAFHLVLLDPNGSLAAEYDLPPAAPWHPTSAWRPGDVWRGQHLLRLPATLDSGDSSWCVSLPSTHQCTNLPSTIHITAPPRTFTRPPSQHPVGVTLGEIATLVGFDLSTAIVQPEDALTATLIWRAEETPIISYRVFAHLLDSEGKLIAQSDAVPADWTRPTTGWLPGEYIADAHTLTIPPDAPAGEYTLSAGLYVPGSECLTAPDGSDAIWLTTISVERQ
jgi:hypothetical protein